MESKPNPTELFSSEFESKRRFGFRTPIHVLNYSSMLWDHKSFFEQFCALDSSLLKKKKVWSFQDNRLAAVSVNNKKDARIES